MIHRGLSFLLSSAREQEQVTVSPRFLAPKATSSLHLCNRDLAVYRSALYLISVFPDGEMHELSCSARPDNVVSHISALFSSKVS